MAKIVNWVTAIELADREWKKLSRSRNRIGLAMAHALVGHGTGLGLLK